MPTKREREYYRIGFRDGASYMREKPASEREIEVALSRGRGAEMYTFPPKEQMLRQLESGFGTIRKTKRKLSPWNKFVKANSKKPRFIYKSGSNKGKLNLKKMSVAFRKTPAGKRKK